VRQIEKRREKGKSFAGILWEGSSVIYPPGMDLDEKRDRGRKGKETKGFRYRLG